MRQALQLLMTKEEGFTIPAAVISVTSATQSTWWKILIHSWPGVASFHTMMLANCVFTKEHHNEPEQLLWPYPGWTWTLHGLVSSWSLHAEWDTMPHGKISDKVVWILYCETNNTLPWEFASVRIQQRTSGHSSNISYRTRTLLPLHTFKMPFKRSGITLTWNIYKT